MPTTIRVKCTDDLRNVSYVSYVYRRPASQSFDCVLANGIPAGMIAPHSVPFSDLAEGEQFVFMHKHMHVPALYLTKIGRGYRTALSGRVWRTGYRAACYRTTNT